MVIFESMTNFVEQTEKTTVRCHFACYVLSEFTQVPNKHEEKI
jgi:hypothetical protein